MNLIRTLWLFCIGYCVVGCQTKPPQSPSPQSVVTQTVASEGYAVTKPQLRASPRTQHRTPEQIQMLQDFAMKESQQIWKTIQAMRAEITESERKIKVLRADLLEFDRKPDADEDYRTLVNGLRELKNAYDAIFDKLEDAYIAAKKYEAAPSRKDYQQIMKRALEDGIQDANMATERYKAMTRQK